uniref:RNA-directed DNA polymerase n=1 Tax=Panagrolaimus superbus TaxID=310955 RepID=A0A914YI87_9BILA
MMEVVFGDMVGTFLFKFLDDILIATETEEQHFVILEEVFKRLIKYGLKLKPKKCEVAKTKLIYLGHVVSAEGVAVGQDKIDKVQNFPAPNCASQVRQFLGLASYHRKFIEGFAKIASPLIALTRKNVVFHWNKEEQESFDQLKEKLINAPILSQPDYETAIIGSKPFVIWTDACKTGVGAVLTQQDDFGNFHPLFYISKACSESERNYSITQLEALAVVVALRKLKTFVMGAKVIVRTDHQPLVGMLKKGNLSPQLIRWALELQEYQDLKIEFVKGKFNVVADALSRCHPDSDYGEHIEVMDSVVLSIENKAPDNWFELLKRDPQFEGICEKVASEGMAKVQRNVYFLKDGCLMRKDCIGRSVKVVPLEFRKLLWQERHSGLLGGHFGVRKIKKLLGCQYFWFNMGKDVEQWTKTCMQCFAHASHRRDRPLLHPIKTDLPMQIVGMDIAEMPLSGKGYKYMLVLIDHFSKYASAFPLQTKSAEEVAKVFLEYWCLREQRIPRQVISDMGLPHKATGETPHFLLHGYDAYTPSQIDHLNKPSRYQTDIEDYKHEVLENLYATQEIVREKLEKYRNQMSLEYNNRNRTRDTNIKVHDLVFVELPTERAKNALSKLAPRWEGPARVVELGKTHVKVKFLHGESFKEIHLSQIVKWQGKECDAQLLKGETSRRTRNRNAAINSVVFSIMVNSNISELYCCSEKECVLTIGMVLHQSKFSETEALSVRDLAEKVTIAASSKMSDEDKAAAFKKADDVLARPEKIHVPSEILKSVWKAVLQKCPHQAKEFKSMLGKPLDIKELENPDAVAEMIAYMNNAYFMFIKNMDTVIVGGENALRIKNAINANYWSISNPEESELRGKVIFGLKTKVIVYVPTEKLLYGTSAQFEAATYIMIQTLNNLERCNSCKVFMLPVFRHLDFPEISQKFVTWYKKTAESDCRLIGMKEFDEMKLINWLNATPSNKEAMEYVNHHGLLTERGTRKLADYLNLQDFNWKHRELQSDQKNDAIKTPTREPFKNFSNSSACNNARGNPYYRGDGNRGRPKFHCRQDDRGPKRKS